MSDQLESLDEPMVELGAVPLRTVLLLRLSIVHHAAGIRPWAELSAEDARTAPQLLAAAEEAQALLERRIAEAGHAVSIHPNPERTS